MGEAANNETGTHSPLCVGCAKPILGAPVVDTEEGCDFCGRCVASMLSAEVKQLREALQGVLDDEWAEAIGGDRLNAIRAALSSGGGDDE